MTAPTVKSPCVNVCALDADDVCIGCFRSMDEIAGWGLLSDEQKQAVLVKADHRYAERYPPLITRSD